MRINLNGEKGMNIVIDKTSEKPLYAQIRDGILEQIRTKSLKSGHRLPTVTALAKKLKTTQATIRRAFEDLANDGYIESHVGRGTFVCNPDNSANISSTLKETQKSAFIDPEFALAARRLRMGIARSLDSLSVLLEKPGLIKFTSGIPDPGIIENGVLSKLTNNALKTDQKIYQGIMDFLGMPELRKELAERYNKEGLSVSPEQILITSGSQQAVSILSQSALENKQRIICETPCYMGIPNAFGAIGHWVESVPRDSEGPIPDRLKKFRDGKPSLFYLCPELHNPMGTDLSPDRRKLIIDWAREQNGLLVADQIFHDLRFEGEKPSSLLSDIDTEHGVVIGSLSKSFMVGLRIGWLISSAERVRSLIALKRAMDIGCPPLMQGIALSLLKSGEYDAHLPKAKNHYKIRRDVLLECLNKYMPDGVTWTIPKGGFHLWVELPQGYSSIALFMLAVERGVAFNPGPKLDIDHRFVNAFHLGYGSVDPDKINEGTELLADAVRELLKQPPSDPGLSGLGAFL